MHFRQFYLGCLAHASYIIGSGTEAAVVDPQRDTEIYMEQAKAHGLTIQHVIETHCHADNTPQPTHRWPIPQLLLAGRYRSCPSSGWTPPTTQVHKGQAC